MAIKELTKETLGKSKSGWTWDRKRELWTTWQADTIFLSERHIRRGFRTEKDAKEYLQKLDEQERLKEIGVIQIIKFPPVKELFDKRLEDIENHAEKIRATRVFKVFSTLVGTNTAIDQITKSHYKKYADFRHSQGKNKKTVNREINPISKAFSAVPDYYTIRNWVKPPVFRFKVSREGRNRLIESEEYNQLLEFFFAPQTISEKFDHFKARYRTGLIFKFALMTGLRHGEICAMEKRKLDRRRREIDVYRFKTRRWKIYAPLTDTMLSLLTEGAELYPAGDYFFSAHGKLQAGFYDQMKKACAMVNIPYGKFTERGIILHDARHTFSSILHENLIDDKTTVEFTDNPSAVGDYQHSTADSKRRAMDIIEKRFGNKNGLLKEFLAEIESGRQTAAQFKIMVEKFCGIS